MAAWVWEKGKEGTWTSFFAPVKEGSDTLTATINAKADSIIFVRFNATAAEPKWDQTPGYIWNAAAQDTIDKVGLTYTITDWYAGTWGVYTPEVPPVLENGYYLVGTLTGWKPATNYLFTVNADNTEEYMLKVKLTAGDELKVAKVTDGAVVAWYPDGLDNYIVDSNHAGEKTIYFQTTYKEDWKDFGGYFYIAPNDATGIDNASADVKAVKVIRDGQVLIIRAGKTYTLQGVEVK